MAFTFLLVVGACGPISNNRPNQSVTQDVGYEGVIPTYNGDFLPRMSRIWKENHTLNIGICVSPLARSLPWLTRLSCHGLYDSYDFQLVMGEALRLDASGRFATWLKTSLGTSSLLSIDILDDREVDSQLRALVRRVALASTRLSATQSLPAGGAEPTLPTLWAGAAIHALKGFQGSAFRVRTRPSFDPDLKWVTGSFFDPYLTQGVRGCTSTFKQGPFDCKVTLTQSACGTHAPSPAGAPLCLGSLGSGEYLKVFDRPEAMVTKATLVDCQTFAAQAQVQCKNGFHRMPWPTFKSALEKVYTVTLP